MILSKLLLFIACIFYVASGSEECNSECRNKQLSNSESIYTDESIKKSAFKGLDPKCLSHDSKPDNASIVYGAFTVSSIQRCRSYCKLAGFCQTFTFNSLTGRCVTYFRFLRDSVIEHNSSLTVGAMVCLECFGDADVVANASRVLIKQEYSLKCLSVGTNQTEFTKEYFLVWKSCADADLWSFTPTNHTYTLSGKETKLVRVSRDSIRNLEWRNRNVFLTKRSSSTTQLFALLESSSSGTACTFAVGAPDYQDGKMKGQVVSHLYTGKVGHNTQTLANVTITRPHPDQQNTCSPKEFSTRRSEVINYDQVPYFLPGDMVTISCTSGFGIKALNCTTRQLVKCGADSPGAYSRLKHCSLITRCEKYEEASLNWQLYYVIGFIAFIVLTYLIVHVVARKRLIEEKERNSNGLQESEANTLNTLNTANTPL